MYFLMFEFKVVGATLINRKSYCEYIHMMCIVQNNVVRNVYRLILCAGGQCKGVRTNAWSARRRSLASRTWRYTCVRTRGKGRSSAMSVTNASRRNPRSTFTSESIPVRLYRVPYKNDFCIHNRFKPIFGVVSFQTNIGQNSSRLLSCT